MASSSAWSLQKSIYDALVNDADVTNLLGGPNVFDDAPRDVSFPYLTLGQSSARDWSTGTELGHEHVLTLHVWSRDGGKKQAQDIMGAVQQALHDQALALEDHHLVNLREEFTDARIDPDGQHYHGIIRYRAVTEPVV